MGFFGNWLRQTDKITSVTCRGVKQIKKCVWDYLECFLYVWSFCDCGFLVLGGFVCGFVCLCLEGWGFLFDLWGFL